MPDAPVPGERSIISEEEAERWENEVKPRLAELEISLYDEFFDPNSEKYAGLDDRVHVTEVYLNLGIFGHPHTTMRDIKNPPDWVHHVASLVAVLQKKMDELTDEYESEDALDFTSIVSLEVYRQITGLKNPPQLISHLRRSYHRDRLPVYQMFGLRELPSPNAFRNAQNERFNPETVEFIKHWARIIEWIALRRGYHIPTIDEKSLSNNGGVIEIPVELKRGYTHGALDLLRDTMPIEKAENAKYDDYGKHFDFSLHLCQSGGTPEGELENFADVHGLQKYENIWGTAETFRNDIYRTPIVAWRAKFNEWTDTLLDVVYDDDLRKRDHCIAVDATNIPTWSREESDLPGVLGTEKLSNTHYAYRILNAEVVEDGLPFQIAHELQMDSANREDRLEALLQQVEDRDFNIGLLLIDSEFASGRIVNRLKELDVDFVIAYPNRHVTKYTDEWEEEGTTFGLEENYIINKSKTRPDKAEVALFGEYQSKLGGYTDEAQRKLSDFFDPEAEWVTEKQTQKTLAAYEEHFQEDIFEADNRMRWFTFITNLDISEGQARALRQYYHYRWAIESAFADYKVNFLPTTRTTNLGMRVYLYLFGMAAYNAWICANTKCRRQHLQDNPRNRPPIRASRFMTLGQQRYRTEEFPRDYINFRE